MKGRYPQSQLVVNRGFTLIEMLTSMAILAVLSGLLFAAFNEGSKAWLQGESRVETFTQARAVLDLMSRELSQAIATEKIPFLGNKENLVFVAPIGDWNDGGDLVEVVYRLNKAALTLAGDPIFDNSDPPKLVRRISSRTSTLPATFSCKNYVDGSPCVAPSPWDFYSSLAIADWPSTSDPKKTQVVAENVVGIQFEYLDAQGTPGVYLDPSTGNNTPYWNSTATPNLWSTELTNRVGGAVSIPAGTIGPFPLANMTNHAPAVVIISLQMLDSRAAARYRSVSADQTARNNIVTESVRTFSTSVSIPNRQP